MSEGQQEHPEIQQKRLRLWLRIGVEVANGVVHVGLAFLLIHIVSNNPQALANWTSWLLIAAVEFFILIVFGAARGAVTMIGPKQIQPAGASKTAHEQPDNLLASEAPAKQSFKEALTSGRETYARVRADLSARYQRAKNGEF